MQIRRYVIKAVLLLIFLIFPWLGLLSAEEQAAESLPEPTVTGGPTYPNGQPPLAVLDGILKTYWAGDPASEEWELTFDFGKVVALTSLQVDYFSKRYQAKETKILLSDDGQKWEEFDVLPIDSFPSLQLNRSTRFVKFEMMGRFQDKQPAIKEVTFEIQKSAIKAAVLKTPTVDARSTVAAAGWPSPVQKTTYRSAADNTLQPTLFYKPDGDKPAPLLVALHTWSNDYLQPQPAYAEWCIAKGWSFLHPNFRGPNNTPEACGSELVVKDIISAVDFAKQNANVDPNRIYLVGVSGGGYLAMLMAGRAPQLWAGVSAWCGIFDLEDWYKQTLTRKLGYADMIARSCGGIPGVNAEVDAQFRARSPRSTLSNAKQLPVDLNTGIFDGHKGSVPTSQTMEAFNCLATPDERISVADIAFITEQAKVPESLKSNVNDPWYSRGKVLMRKTSGNTRMTVFEGGHVILFEAALAWLEQQRKGKEAVWAIPFDSSANMKSLSIEAGK